MECHSALSVPSVCVCVCACVYLCVCDIVKIAFTAGPDDDGIGEGLV